MELHYTAWGSCSCRGIRTRDRDSSGQTQPVQRVGRGQHDGASSPSATPTRGSPSKIAMTSGAASSRSNKPPAPSALAGSSRTCATGVSTSRWGKTLAASLTATLPSVAGAEHRADGTQAEGGEAVEVWKEEAAHGSAPASVRMGWGVAAGGGRWLVFRLLECAGPAPDRPGHDYG